MLEAPARIFAEGVVGPAPAVAVEDAGHVPEIADGGVDRRPGDHAEFADIDRHLVFLLELDDRPQRSFQRRLVEPDSADEGRIFDAGRLLRPGEQPRVLQLGRRNALMREGAGLVEMEAVNYARIRQRFQVLETAPAAAGPGFVDDPDILVDFADRLHDVDRHLPPFDRRIRQLAAAERLIVEVVPPDRAGVRLQPFRDAAPVAFEPLFDAGDLPHLPAAEFAGNLEGDRDDFDSGGLRLFDGLFKPVEKDRIVFRRPGWFRPDSVQLEPHRIRSPVIRHVVKRPAVVEPSGHEAADDRRGGAAPGERPEVFEGLARAAPPAVFLDRRTGADRFDRLRIGPHDLHHTEHRRVVPRAVVPVEPAPGDFLIARLAVVIVVVAEVEAEGEPVERLQAEIGVVERNRNFDAPSAFDRNRPGFGRNLPFGAERLSGRVRGGDEKLHARVVRPRVAREKRVEEQFEAVAVVGRAETEVDMAVLCDRQHVERVVRHRRLEVRFETGRQRRVARVQERQLPDGRNVVPAFDAPLHAFFRGVKQRIDDVLSGAFAQRSDQVRAALCLTALLLQRIVTRGGSGGGLRIGLKLFFRLRRGVCGRQCEQRRGDSRQNPSHP